MKRILTTASAAFLALGTAASAATFSLMDETAGIIPGAGAVNEVLINTFGAGGAAGYFGAEIYLDEASDIQVSAFGFEAGFVNEFQMGGQSITTSQLEAITGTTDEAYAANETAPLTGFTLNNVASGLLDFSFLTSGFGGAQVDNGNNPDNGGTNPNFFVSFGKDSLDQVVFLFFDDGGAENDDNHDDLVIRLSIGDSNTVPNPVPLPATGLLLLGALGGMRMMKRRS
ncbi:MAG: hypothetical protein ABJQ34_21380 [Paracoccaceae bacterium]|uniref:hypothetical protein n=1 Tax=Sulfitobacter sp. TaxID=1903071 RepID=UPI00329115F6